MPTSQSKPEQAEWAKLAAKDLGRYFLAINTGYRYVDYQQEVIVPAVMELDRGKFDRLMIFISPGHAKTDIATKAFIPWYFGQHRHAGKNVMLITRAKDLAVKFGAHIRDVMRSAPLYKRIFPHIRLDGTSQAKVYFKTNQYQEFMAFGADSGIAGNRADLIVMEDWIANLQEAQSEEVQSHLYEDIYKPVIRDRLRPKGKMLFIMTRWGTRDVAARILDDEGERWKVLVIPAQEHIEGCADNAECRCPYLWEEHFGRAKYDEAKSDRALWTAMWQQSPRPLLNQGFDESWLRFYLPAGASPQYRQAKDNLGENLGPPVPVAVPVDYQKLFKFNAYIFVDPAMGKTAGHDRTAILVFAAGPDHRVFLVDAVLDRLDPGERIDALIRLVKLWKPRAIFYEEYGLVADTYFLNVALKRAAFSFDVSVQSVGRKSMNLSGGGRLKKHDRIMQLQPMFRDGEIWLPRRMVRHQLDGTDIDIISYFINREYLPYAGDGSIQHDDMLDCMSRLREPEVYLEHRERPSDDEEEYEISHRPEGTWESRY